MEGSEAVDVGTDDVKDGTVVVGGTVLVVAFGTVAIELFCDTSVQKSK